MGLIKWRASTLDNCVWRDFICGMGHQVRSGTAPWWSITDTPEMRITKHSISGLPSLGLTCQRWLPFARRLRIPLSGQQVGVSLGNHPSWLAKPPLEMTRWPSKGWSWRNHFGMTFSTLAPTDSLPPSAVHHAPRSQATSDKKNVPWRSLSSLGSSLGCPRKCPTKIWHRNRCRFRCRSTDLFNVVHGSTVHRRGKGALRHLGGCGCGHHLLARGAPLGSDMCFHYVKKLGLAMDSPNFWLFWHGDHQLLEILGRPHGSSGTEPGTSRWWK